MTAILEIRSLSAGYDRVPVIRNIDLAVEEGSIATIVGANGTGKTTAWVLENGAIALHGTGPELLSDENTRRAYLGM